ncbi:MAG: type II toxin-antitoxin system HicB family antitoxin [Ferruginibacter sp.]
MSKYLIIIENKKTDFSAYSPDVPGCTASGNTIQAALKQMIKVLEKHFQKIENLPEPKGLNYYMNDDSFKKGSTDFILLAELDED